MVRAMKLQLSDLLASVKLRLYYGWLHKMQIIEFLNFRYSCIVLMTTIMITKLIIFASYLICSSSIVLVLQF